MSESPQDPQPPSSSPLPQRNPNEVESLIQLIHPLVPAVRDYLDATKKEKETDQMSVQFDFQIRDKELTHLRDEQKEARLERRELRRFAMIVSALLAVVLLVLILKEQNTVALEMIKLLAGILGPAFGAYWYGKAKGEAGKGLKIDKDDDPE